MKLFNRWRYGKYINSEMLIKWLEGQKYGYIKNKRQWELGRNRMIEKAINAIKYGEDYMKY